LINYQKLFFSAPAKEGESAEVAKQRVDQTLSAEDILSNAELLDKVQQELRLSEE
jgi:hypothetical protein